MKIGEVIGWEPAEAGSFSSLSILSFFLVHANFLIQKNYANRRYHSYGGYWVSQMEIYA